MLKLGDHYYAFNSRWYSCSRKNFENLKSENGKYNILNFDGTRIEEKEKLTSARGNKKNLFRGHKLN